MVLQKQLWKEYSYLSNNISKTNFICLRFGNIAWSTGSVLPIWKRMFNKNKIILTTGPYMKIFIYS